MLLADTSERGRASPTLGPHDERNLAEERRAPGSSEQPGHEGDLVPVPEQDLGEGEKPTEMGAVPAVAELLGRVGGNVQTQVSGPLPEPKLELRVAGRQVEPRVLPEPLPGKGSTREIAHRTLIDEGPLDSPSVLDDEARRGGATRNPDEPAEVDPSIHEALLERRGKLLAHEGDEAGSDSKVGGSPGNVHRGPPELRPVARERDGMVGRREAGHGKEAVDVRVARDQ